MVLGLPRPILCAFRDRLPTETTRDFFLDHFLKETTLSFFFWFLESVQCIGKTFFVPYLLPSHVNVVLILKIFRHFKTPEGKLCDDEVNRASVL